MTLTFLPSAAARAGAMELSTPLVTNVNGASAPASSAGTSWQTLRYAIGNDGP